MKAIIDSNVFIAAWHQRDEHNDKAIRILRQVAQAEAEEIFITNYVVLEVVNFLLRKASFEMAQTAMEYLTKTERIKIIFVDAIMGKQIEPFFSKYKTLSLTDCSILSLAEEFGITVIYSFDAGFDKVKGVERREHYIP